MVLIDHFLFCRRCCGLHDVVLECSAWCTWRHKEKTMWVGKCSILNCYVIIHAVKVLDVIFDRYLGQFYIKCFPFTKVELSLAFWECKMFHILLLEKCELTSVLLCLCALKAIITKAFQGSMRIFSKKLPHPDLVSFPACVMKSLILHPDQCSSNLLHHLLPKSKYSHYDRMQVYT